MDGRPRRWTRKYIIYLLRFGAYLDTNEKLKLFYYSAYFCHYL